MAVANEIAVIAAECFKHPGKRAIWSESNNRFICESDPAFNETPEITRTPISLSSAFKMTFVIVAILTVSSIVICLFITYLFHNSMPSILEIVTKGLLQLAGIGIGAIAGLYTGLMCGKRRPSSRR